uniref:Uncharacterized protein n=1 Tax=Pseudo-nitzschia australis TaxID=44445 RepID=A0A7S4EJ59_9STRA|mmetsp:Transcript_27516/g.59225  ORF Transcript_27516/g.59225 Transcript_27516/m.59225 type:complete len:1015 (+) Transcript_27516:199-3243(+)
MAKAPTRKDKGKTATSAASKKSKSKKKDDAAVKKPRSETFVVCPYTDQKVWISKATLSDLKPTTTHKNGNRNKTSSSSSSRKSVHKNDKKRLWTISSSHIRHDHYAEVAQALSIYEQNLLPSSGDRSWEVSVQLSEPNARVLFRSWKGQMELACLPHLIDRIPKPPIWPGKRNQPADDYRAMQGEEELEYTHYGGRKRPNKNTKQDYIKGLANREISVVSQVAWEVLKPKYDHPAPTVSIKWRSPDAKTFTSRKSAWEHATHLSNREVTIDRNLLGIGASGKLLKEFIPTAKISIEAGRLRFERDGLWVVGQATSWQADREEELKLQEEEKEAATSKVYTSGLQLYVAENRHSYREEHGTNLAQADKALRHQWRCLSPKEQQLWNEKVQEQFEDDDSSDDDDKASSLEEEKEIEDENGSDNVSHDIAAAKDDNTASGDENNSNDNEDDDESSVEYISHYQYFVQQRRHDYRHEEQIKLEAAAAGGNSDGNNVSKKKKFTLVQADKELRQQWKEMAEEQQDEWILKLKRMEEEVEKKEETSGSGEGIISKSSLSINSNATVVTNDWEEKESKKVAEETDFHQSTSNIESDKGCDSNFKIEAGMGQWGKESKDDNIKINQNKNRGGTHGFEEEKKADDEAEFAESSAINTPSPDEIASSAKSTAKAKGRKSTKNSAPPKKSPGTTTNQTTNKRKTKSARKPSASSKYCLNAEQITKCHDACMEHYETVMRTVKSRDLSRELADGFDVLRERGHGRFDMELPAFGTCDFDFLTDFDKTPWMPIVKAILEEDVGLIHKGCFMSLPGAGSQVYHQDGVHLTTQTQRPCHAINVFVPLVDLHSRNGPTEFVLGSHVLGHDGYDRDFLETPKPSAGTPVIFDYRLGHRGLSNSSPSCRPIVYCTYARAADGKEFRDSVNFSRRRYHKIGELSTKPLSREERRNKRKRSIESAREKEELEQAVKVSSSMMTTTDKTKTLVVKDEPNLTTVVNTPIGEAKVVDDGIGTENQPMFDDDTAVEAK